MVGNFVWKLEFVLSEIFGQYGCCESIVDVVAFEVFVEEEG